MTAKKAGVRRAAGAGLALVLALVGVGSVAAATARDRTPPTTPTNLRVTSLSHKSVTLAWDPSTDNSGSFSYSVNTFTVKAVDRAGNTSEASNAFTAFLWPC